MVSVAAVVVGGALTLLCLYYAYRLANTARLSYSLRGVSPERSPAVVDGQRVTIEGVVTVDEEAPASDRATDGLASPVGMYVWQAAFPRSGQRVIDFENRTTRQARATFASGVEYGSFSVATENGDVRVDPSWLRAAHDADKLSEVQPVGFLPSRTWHVYLWNSPYVELSEHPTEMSLERLRAVVDDDPEIDLGDDSFLSKAVVEGSRLTVHGELSVGPGPPTIQGTNDTPLFVSDGGIDAVRRSLRRRALTYGVYLVAAAAATVVSVLAFS
ncbi:hypothetical protein SAMN04487949_2709 [Halogranum gelatinilyticum]|uniref:Uncharacterized protein n=1 Tax=Halogranum gelatinilyticum TaxID=660521 RepID=A0A1G9WEA2_9EURY|nr:hypothetical protein [Halogranum gelatinilyticum]SDM82355.1 hypothetical protein SAMN04487949_2709 [Halogranum gelatinilyticum]